MYDNKENATRDLNLDIGALAKDIHKNSIDHGFWDKPSKFSTIISLIHSELTEALEFERDSNKLKELGIDPLIHYSGTVENSEASYLFEGTNTKVGSSHVMSNVPNNHCDKPDGILPELADVVIRVLDYVEYLDMTKEFVDVMIDKHEFNKTRPHKRGGKKF